MGLYCTYVHYTRKNTADKEAKKVHHLLALQSARAAACLRSSVPSHGLWIRVDTHRDIARLDDR